jgi:hypothetical protein
MTVYNSSAGTDERQPQQKLVNGIIAKGNTKINEYFMNIFNNQNHLQYCFYLLLRSETYYLSLHDLTLEYL